MGNERPSDKTIPFVLTPEQGIDDSPRALAAWINENRNSVDEILYEKGAILLRYFNIDTPEAFRDVATALRPGLKPYVGGDSPRTSVGDGLYTSTEFPPSMEIGLHNELSYTRAWPERVFFCCLIAPESGGETPIADSREVHASMEPSVLERFERLGVIYRQHLRDADVPGPGKSWQESFETSDRGEVERVCDEQGMGARWTGRGLRTSLRNPAVLEHPVNGHACWFNQADLWHAHFDTVKAQEHASPGRRSDEEALGCHALYGDGSEIPIADLEAVREAYGKSKKRFPWLVGDVLILDNVLMMHGREPFEGERRVLVAMA